MNSELDALEVKVEQILALVHRLRAENEVLRNQLATASKCFWICSTRLK